MKIEGKSKKEVEGMRERRERLKIGEKRRRELKESEIMLRRAQERQRERERESWKRERIRLVGCCWPKEWGKLGKGQTVWAVNSADAWKHSHYLSHQ